MDQNLMMKQRELTRRLNIYRNEYYNKNSPSISDEVYDRLFDELKELEEQTGIQLANSPTDTVGYPAVPPRTFCCAAAPIWFVLCMTIFPMGIRHRRKL